MTMTMVGRPELPHPHSPYRPSASLNAAANLTQRRVVRPYPPNLMDPAHIVIALGPLGGYLLFIGLLNLGRRPFVTSGGRDLAALAIGISGLMIVGPLELFMPDAPARRFGAFVWLLLLALYGLGVTLVTLLTRPRIVVYNVTPQQMHSMVEAVAASLDEKADWAGDCLQLPQLGIQLNVETNVSMGIGELVSAGPHQSFQGWRQLEYAMAKAFRESPARGRKLSGAMFSFVGIGLLLGVVYWVVNHHPAVAQGLREMLSR